MAAGCSGGDWDAVCDGWTLQRFAAMVRYWKRNGPPEHISMAVFTGIVKDEAPAEGLGAVSSPDEVAEWAKMVQGSMQ